MKVALENAAHALASSDSMTLEAARAFREILFRRRKELDQQVAAIKDPSESGDDRWSKMLAAGTTDEMRELEAEYEALSRDLDRVRAQYGQFARMEVVCRQREAVASVPGRLDDLESKADAVTAARAALDEACHDLADAFQATGQAFDNAADSPVAPAKPSEALVAKVRDAASGAAYTPPKGRLYRYATQEPRRIAEELHRARVQGTVPAPAN